MNYRSLIIANCRNRSSRGFALLVVLGLIVVMIALAADISFSSRVSATIAADHRDQMRAYFLAKSGADVSLLRLKIDNLADNAFGKKDSLNESHWSEPFQYPEGLAMLTANLQEVGIAEGATEKFVADNELGGSFISILEDEASKINVNAVGLQNNIPNGSFILLLNLLTLEQFESFFQNQRPIELVQNIQDWLDKDNQGARGTQESQSYLNSDIRYEAKNGPLFSIKELLLVDGMDPVLLDAIEDYITIFPYTLQNVGTQDFGKINVNTVSATVLAAVLNAAELTNVEETAEKIIEERDKQPFKDVSSFLNAVTSLTGVDRNVAITIPVQATLVVRSDVFSITSEATVGSSTAIVEAVVDRAQQEPYFFNWVVK